MKTYLHPHRLLVWALCAALAFTFCLPAGSATAAAGGYVEKELASPTGYSMFTGPAALPSGGFAQAAKREDDGEWELLAFSTLTETPAVLPLDSAAGEIASLSAAPDGQIMAVISAGFFRMRPATRTPGNDPSPGESDKPDETAGVGQQIVQMRPDEMRTTMVWYDESGAAVTSFDVAGMLFSTVALSGRKMAALSAGMGRSAVSIYDDKGNTLASINRDEVRTMVAGPGGGLYLVLTDTVTLVDQGGQTLGSYPLPQDVIRTAASSPDGTLYLIGLTGIYRLETGSAETVQIADTARYLIGAPDSNLSGLCAMNDGSLVTQMGGGSGVSMQASGAAYRQTAFRIGMEGDESSMIAYVFNPDLDMDADTVFTVTALRDSIKVRSAVSAFQRAHPELKVNYNPSMAAEDTDSPVEDAIRTLNTDLLAGKGGDVMILDEMPLTQYIGKGVLLPLDDILSDIGFIPGILKGSRYTDGVLYAMPAQFQFDTLWGRRDLLSGAGALNALSGLPLDNAQELLYARSPEDLLKLFYPASRAAFVNGPTDSGKPRFDTQEFETFLEELYGMYSAQLSEPVSGSQQGPGRRMMNREEIQGMINGSVAAMAANINSTMGTAMPYTVAGAEDSCCIPVPGLHSAGRAYKPAPIAGIHARTSSRALSEEFLRLLYSPEIQELESMEGLPTVAATLDKLVNDSKEIARGGEMQMAMSFGGNAITLKQLDDDTWDALRALIDTLDQAYIDDPTLMGFMVEETAGFFEGYGTAQDTAWALQQRASAYLNE